MQNTAKVVFFFMNPSFEKILAYHKTSPEQATEYGAQWLHLMLRCAEKAFLIRSKGYIAPAEKTKQQYKLDALSFYLDELIETTISVSPLDSSDEIAFGRFKGIKPHSLKLAIKPHDGGRREFVQYGEIEANADRKFVTVQPNVTLCAPIPPNL